MVSAVVSYAAPHMRAMVDHRPATMPTIPGQGAFGAVHEIVRLLEADPTTDWRKVNLAAPRVHLIDMNEVTLRPVAAQRGVEGGIEIAVTGDGRTLDAIRRMVPAHAQELDRFPIGQPGPRR
ncbi:hypothetical protein [Neoroseomonas lacus]|uniref:Uncharacterized protein n=1 Tax=Neoroseomonas lacus TaxID=287609 RepID=A0A917L6C5_9PROT|nr:hypothetical protein [Neoroseomonas lacus]GGJ44648.1 hypothetical protein GCM10011320_60120 [Neoroseomonas lacus]